MSEDMIKVPFKLEEPYDEEPDPESSWMIPHVRMVEGWLDELYIDEGRSMSDTKDIDAVWKKRAEDEAQIRLCISELAESLRELQAVEDPRVVFDVANKIHTLIAMHMATLERYTRPIPIAPPFPVPVEIFADMSRRFREYGIPVYLIAQVKKGDD